MKIETVLESENQKNSPDELPKSKPISLNNIRILICVAILISVATVKFTDSNIYSKFNNYYKSHFLTQSVRLDGLDYFMLKKLSQVKSKLESIKF